MTPRGRRRVSRWAAPALVGASLLVWLLLAVTGRAGAPALLAAGLTATAAVVAAGPGAVAWRRWRFRRASGASDSAPDFRVDDDSPGGGRLDRAGLDALLLRLCRGLGAVRVTLWEHDAAAGRLQPVHCSHEPPLPVGAAGDPLLWAISERQPLRLEPTPSWAVGPTTAAAAGERLILTAEGEEASPTLGGAADAAAVVHSFRAAGERERVARAHSARLDRLLAFLQTLTGGADADGFADELTRALAELAGADGALVATWKDERGRVLARWGQGGGPAPGTYFGVMDGDLAMAARAGSPIHRERAGRMVLAHAGERWSTPPKHVTVVPLVDASGAAAGVCAFWGGTPADDGATQLVQALAPLLALQLRHSTDLVRFRQRAHEDVLTGLRNRAALEEKLTEERNRFHRYRRPLSLLILDLDHFKRVNDAWGHAAGDAVLERVADIIRAAIRDADYAFRYGGEEIVILLPETMRHAAGEVAERIRKTVSLASFDWGGHHIPVTLSIGVSACPETVHDPDQLLKSADDALYASKNAGRNRVTVAMPDT